MGVMGTFASESAKYYAVENLLSDQVKKAINENILYPHDLDFMQQERRLVHKFR